MQYETCRHLKEDGAYCGSPALQDRKYCYYHLMERGRRLRRARALRDNIPYRLEIQSLDSPHAIRTAITGIVQALGTGQLDHRIAGKMLYGIQQVTALNRRIVAAEEAAAAKVQEQAQPAGARVQEYPGFEQEFGINPGADVDVETGWTLRKADEEAELRQANDLPAPPPGMRIGSPQYHVYREEAYQNLNALVNSMRHQLRDYYEMKRKESEKLIEEAMSVPPPQERLANSA
jgi:hypothetical protein